jgi:hypothetical protein
MFNAKSWLWMAAVGLTVALAVPASAQWYPQQDQGWHRDHDRDNDDRDRDHDRDRDQADQYGYGQNGYYNNSAYRQGYNDGIQDRNNGNRVVHRHAWKSDQDARAYAAGYDSGYNGAANGRWGNNGRWNNGGYGAYRGAYGNVRGQAGRIGYRDGINDGQHDRSTGHSFRPTQDDNYKNADRGYSSSFGDKQSYKNAYRQGYEQGYQQGYNAGGSGWRR